MDRPIVKSSSSGRGWASCTSLYYKDVSFDNFLPDDVSEEARAWLFREYGNEWVRLEAYIECGYDHTVGVNYGYDMDEWFLDEDFEKLVDECPLLTDEQREAIVAKMEEYAEEKDGYEPYDVD